MHSTCPTWRYGYGDALPVKDKTQLARGEKADFDAVYLKLGNTGDAAWAADVNKILFAVFPTVDRGEMNEQEHKQAKMLVNQQCWAWLHVLLEDCAEWGIVCNHRSHPYSASHSNIRGLLPVSTEAVNILGAILPVPVECL